MKKEARISLAEFRVNVCGDLGQFFLGGRLRTKHIDPDIRPGAGWPEVNRRLVFGETNHFNLPIIILEAAYLANAAAALVVRRLGCASNTPAELLGAIT